MTDERSKYDEYLTSILVNEKSLLGFLSSIFNFLARRTDFYYVPKGPHEDMGFPVGMAEELVLKVLRSCDPFSKKGEGANIHNDIMVSTVAQEIEVVTETDDSGVENISSSSSYNNCQTDANTEKKKDNDQSGPSHSKPLNAASLQNKAVNAYSLLLDKHKPPTLNYQTTSEGYNGAVRDKYSWSQTISDIDVTIKLPVDIKSTKDFTVAINANDMLVQGSSGTNLSKGEIYLKESFPFRVKAMESFWTVSEEQLLIHLEKAQERWWDKLFLKEDAIDLSKIDASRPMSDLPDDHIAKIRELQFNQEQKMKGLPTSTEIKNLEILKKAWNVEGSPFKGQEFDPNVLYK